MGAKTEPQKCQENVPVAAFLDEIEEYEFLLTTFDEKRRKRLLRKIDWRLLPVLAIFYLMSFMDRTNMGNARLQGLEEDLEISPQQFNWHVIMALSIFFFPYGIFEVPSNIALKFTKPSIWMPSIMLAWGVVMMCMGWVTSYAGLLSARFFLGMAEAGLFPAATYLCTIWYCRYELQFRIALFYCAASIAGSFSGLLAYGIGFMQGIRGYHGWRWIFILEGLLTIVVAIASYPFVCDSPETSSWLTLEEKRFLTLRLKFDGQERGYEEQKFQRYYLIQAFTDSKVWLCSILFLFCCTGTYSLSFSLPTTIEILGYTAAEAQLLTIPVYAVASVLCVLNALLADKLRKRYPSVILPFAIGVVGVIVCLTFSPLDKPGVFYFAMILIACAIYPAIPGIVCWVSNNLAGQWKRSIGMALQFSGGNLIGGVLGSNIFLARESPTFHTAYYILLAFFAAGIVISVLQAWTLRTANVKREKLINNAAEEDLRELDDDTKHLGDKSPFFRYTL